MSIEAIELTPDLAGDLFRITQEAAVNAGRHAGAANISIALREIDGWVELRIVDDGEGFGDVDPLGATEPGHLGLAAMRERTKVRRHARDRDQRARDEGAGQGAAAAAGWRRQP